MADITQAEFQDQVADSLLGDSNIIAVLPHQGNLSPQDTGSDAEHGESVFDNPEDYFAEEYYAQEHDPQKLGDEGLRQLLTKEGQQIEQGADDGLTDDERRMFSQEERIRRGIENEQPEAEQEPQEKTQQEPAEQQQAQPVTMEVFQEQMQGLDTFIKENALNDGAEAATFPYELAGAFGTTPEAAGIDSQGVIDFSSKAVVSSLREIETGSYTQEMPELAAREVGFLAAKMLGHDPRGENVNLVDTGRTMRELTNNILLTIAHLGTADPEKVNSRENIEGYFNQLQKNLGGRGQFPFEIAKKIADSYVRRIGAAVEQLRQNQAQRAEQVQAKPRKSGQRIPRGMTQGIKGGKVQEFETNPDLFDKQTMRTHAMRRL